MTAQARRRDKKREARGRRDKPYAAPHIPVHFQRPVDWMAGLPGMEHLAQSLLGLAVRCVAERLQAKAARV